MPEGCARPLCFPEFFLPQISSAAVRVERMPAFESWGHRPRWQLWEKQQTLPPFQEKEGCPDSRDAGEDLLLLVTPQRGIL